MTEYIKREEAIEAAKHAWAKDLEPSQYIEIIPAADVAPVRHGRWDGDTCTSCNLPWNYNMTQNAQDWGYFDPMPDYCPNCGARMNEEVKHER